MRTSIEKERQRVGEIRKRAREMESEREEIRKRETKKIRKKSS